MECLVSVPSLAPPAMMTDMSDQHSYQLFHLLTTAQPLRTVWVSNPLSR